MGANGNASPWKTSTTQIGPTNLEGRASQNTAVAKPRVGRPPRGRQKEGLPWPLEQGTRAQGPAKQRNPAAARPNCSMG
eukprot:4567580-Lingulodinium_polyedra.AAC.1